jgi:hypothetical protein
MKSLLITVIATILFIPEFHAQNSGLYGNKNYIEISGLGYYPLFANAFNKSSYPELKYFKLKNNTLNETKDRFNYGFRVTLGTAIKRNFGLAVEGGISYMNIPTPVSFRTPNYYYYTVHHEMLDVRTISILPKIEFTKEGGLLPIGLSHQIGFGYFINQIVDRDYVYQLVSGQQVLTQQEIATIGERFVNTERKYKGYTLLYSFTIRTPITKSIMINYGIRYTLNLLNQDKSLPYVDANLYSARDVQFQLRRRQLTNFLTFNLGATFAF